MRLVTIAVLFSILFTAERTLALDFSVYKNCLLSEKKANILLSRRPNSGPSIPCVSTCLLTNGCVQCRTGVASREAVMTAVTQCQGSANRAACLVTQFASTCQPARARLARCSARCYFVDCNR